MLHLKREIDRTDLSPGSRLETLRSTVELGGCSLSELRSLLRHVDEVTVPAGALIASQGQSCSEFVIVATGRLRAGSLDTGWHTLVPGNTAGWAAMWEMAANDETVVAETEARLLVMSHAQFRAVKAIASRPASVVGQSRFRRTPEPFQSNKRAG
jgi:CRP-like cAMP-binding protein